MSCLATSQGYISESDYTRNYAAFGSTKTQLNFLEQSLDLIAGLPCSSCGLWHCSLVLLLGRSASTTRLPMTAACSIWWTVVVCKNMPKSTCQWCSGSGGPAAIGSASSVPAETSNLVDCGVCKNVPKSTCQWCSGTGGPATVGSAASPASSNLVDCGVCKNVPKSTCQWCDGAGGNAPVNSRPATPDSGSPASSGMYDGSCPAGLVNCGVCRCTVPSACKTCDGSGGPGRDQHVRCLVHGPQLHDAACGFCDWLLGSHFNGGTSLQVHILESNANSAC